MTSLAEATEELYRSFSKYQRHDCSDACPHCVDLDERELEIPLRHRSGHFQSNEVYGVGVGVVVDVDVAEQARRGTTPSVCRRFVSRKADVQVEASGPNSVWNAFIA